MVPAGALGAAPPSRIVPWLLSLTAPPPRGAPSPRTVGAVRPASRPRTPAWLPRASTPPRIAGLPERTPSLWLPTLERLGALTEPLRLGLLLDERLGLLNELRLELLLDERLGLLLIELRLDELLDERLLLMELWLLLEERLLLMELLWLLPPPPLRLPPLRCANAGVALSARAIIASAITFEVFIMLLLSYYYLFVFFAT